MHQITLFRKKVQQCSEKGAQPPFPDSLGGRRPLPTHIRAYGALILGPTRSTPATCFGKYWIRHRTAHAISYFMA